MPDPQRVWLVLTAFSRTTLFVVAAILAAGLSIEPVCSQGRTEEDTLVLTDPTVAGRDQWKLGGSVEYWRVTGKVPVYDFTGQTKVAEADITLNQPGFSLFAAREDWTIQYTRRDGEGDSKIDLSQPGVTITVSGPTKQTDQEILLRYLFRSWSTRFLTPYALLGYTTVEIVQDYALTAVPDDPLVVIAASFLCSGTDKLRTTHKLSGPEVGLGGIFPFSRTFGARADARLVRYSGKRRSGNCPEFSGSGWGSAYTLTGYANVGAGFNLQLGMKWSDLNAGDAAQFRRQGYFGMLGYTHNF